jgi:hypothetical protein
MNPEMILVEYEYRRVKLARERAQRRWRRI